MIVHSQELDDVIRSGSIVSSYRATVFRGTDIVLGPDECELAGAPVIGVDETALSVRTLNATVIDPTGTLLPLDYDDALAPYGQEMQLEIGIWIPTLGDFEWVPQGRFALFRNNADTSRQIQVTGYERSLKIAAALNEAPYVMAGGFLADQVNTYLQTKYPGIALNADAASYAIALPGGPRVFQEGSTDGDPWKNMKDLVKQFGRDLNIDPSGGAVLQPVPDPADSVITWDYVTGDENLAMSGALSNDTEAVHNVWVVSGEAQDGSAPVRAVVEVTDTASPIYAGAGTLFGRRPAFFTSSFFTTSAQCQTFGEALRLAETGKTQGATFNAMPHPCHEAKDLVRYQSDLLGVDFRLVLSAWQFNADLRQETSYKVRLVG